MSEAITTDGYRQRLAAHKAGISTAKKIAFMAFGNGGHNGDNTAKSASAAATSLYNEILRVPLGAVTQEDMYSVTGEAIVYGVDIEGGVFSEVALLDEDGEMDGWKTFPPKFVEEGESYTAILKLRF